MTTAVEKRKIVIALGLALGALFLALFARGTGPQAAQAASHREAPLIALDPTADITDFFMFRDYAAGQQDKVALIMDVIPGEEPSSGPNYWNFDPNVLYKFSVDNNGDGKADDVELEFRFKTEPIRGLAGQLTLPLSYLGGAGGLPPITALDGPGSEGLGLRQRYSVTLVRGHHRTQVANGLIAVPSNVGPRTMPDYASLAAQGTYDLGNGIKVFAGQREDPFYIDLGGVFDTLNLRRVPPVETPAEDANDNVNPFGTDMLSGFNVHSIAIELPASMLTGDTGATTIGAYAARAGRTSRSTATATAGSGRSSGSRTRSSTRRSSAPSTRTAGTRWSPTRRAGSRTTTSTRAWLWRWSSCSAFRRPRRTARISATCCSSTSRATRGSRSSCG